MMSVAADTRRFETARAIHNALLWTIVVALSALVAIELALALVLPLVMIAYPGELMYGEAILYDHARRIVEGVPL